MPYKDLVRSRYEEHKRRAKSRGIQFLMTYGEWCIVWLESGKWDQRGHSRGEYCMARKGDKGAYELGNVKICLVEDNAAERNRNYRNGPEVMARRLRDERGWFLPGRKSNGAELPQ